VVGVVAAGQLAVGVEHEVCLLPERAGLPQPARLGVPDRGDRASGQRGEFKLGQPRLAAQRGQRPGQGAGRVGHPLLPARGGDPGAGVAGDAARQGALGDQAAQRLAAGQR
jgi:hypothetical protein